ncbi:hypothetical protein TWF703_001730 [Orbilia oligospora]|uniref:Major facilitator superfamily (MFS) profile domain-containing protein n=1 Tax=Orbilia oligospora TaxID=2813651 RepID=A0A7C8JZK7_ORBOL|nr:hypothetical protein TWF703_001730 [Orbilia oligospora]
MPTTIRTEDETSPLLRKETVKKGPRLPLKQLSILALCRVADPICMTSVFSYLPQMIRSFGVSENEIGVWAGVISASLALCKPSILLGLVAMMASTIAFGFSTSITMAIVTRCLIGLTGNVGILRTVAAELAPDPDLKLQALGILPLAWNLGTITGPAIGGFLSEPAQKYPSLFPPGGFFDKSPWALPNLLIALMIFTGGFLAFLFLDETLGSKQRRYDPGRAMGKKIESFFGLSFSEQDSTSGLAHDVESHPKQAADNYAGANPNIPPTWSEVLTPQSKYLVVLFFISALHRVTAEQLFSLFFATRGHSSKNPIRLPFHLPGGFGLNSSQLGLLFAALGVVEILTQLFIFAPMARKYGNRALLCIAALADPILYFAIPYTLALYEKHAGLGGNWVCYTTIAVILMLCSMNSVLGLNSVVILVTDSASSARALATLNGFATSVAAFGVAIGPSTFGWLYTVGQKSEWSTIPWVGLALVASSMWIWIPKVKVREPSNQGENEVTTDN